MFSNIKKSLEYVSFIAYKKNLRVTKISDEPCLEFTEGASFLWDTSLVVDKINEKNINSNMSKQIMHGLLYCLSSGEADVKVVL